MLKILVWTLVLNSSAGGIAVIDNIATQEDCERMRTRSSQATNRKDDFSYMSGACTQAWRLVPDKNTTGGVAPVADVGQVADKSRTSVKPR